VLGVAPSEVLRRVATLLGDFAESTFVTYLYAVLTAEAGLVYANAGHLPALLRRADGTIEQHGEALAQAARRRRRVPREHGGVPVWRCCSTPTGWWRAAAETSPRARNGC
jgi:hypothetical protein